MSNRLIPLGITMLAVLYLGIASLELQVGRTEAYVNFSAQPERVNQSFNASKSIFADVTTALGVGLPAIFSAVAVVLVAVFLWMVSGR